MHMKLEANQQIASHVGKREVVEIPLAWLAFCAVMGAVIAWLNRWYHMEFTLQGTADKPWDIDSILAVMEPWFASPSIYQGLGAGCVVMAFLYALSALLYRSRDREERLPLFLVGAICFVILFGVTSLRLHLP